LNSDNLQQGCAFANHRRTPSACSRCAVPSLPLRAALSAALPGAHCSVAATTQLLHIEVIVELLSGALCHSPAHIEVVVKLMQGASLCCLSRRSWGHCATHHDMCCPEGRSMQLCHSPATTDRRAASRYRHCRCPPTMTQLGASGRSGAAWL
jgi:hypothetical protein